MKKRKFILLLASGGAMFQLFGCDQKAFIWFDAINQLIQSAHALGLVAAPA